MSSLLELPNELIHIVVEQSEDADLPSLRLICRRISTIATSTFTIRLISERNHVVSEKSLEALAEITSHPMFGPCVKSIFFNTAETTYGTNSSDVILKSQSFYGTPIYWLRFHNKFEVVFANIAKWGNTGTTIGVTDNYPKHSQSACVTHDFWKKSEKPSYGWSGLMRGVSGAYTANLFPGHFVLQYMLCMAANVGCKVDCIETRVWLRYGSWNPA
jgi:hypothetical protein